MTRIPSDVASMHKMRLKELQGKKPHSSSFKKIIEEKRSTSKDAKEDEGKECVISIFELPRSHFECNDIDTSGCQVPGVAPNIALANIGESQGSVPVSSVQLPAEIEALFDKMAGTMLLLSSSGENETTLFLNNSNFDNSAFYGTRITIKEFSTAPRAFNVEIAASSAVLAQLNAHKSALLDAFAKGDFNFSIGRLDTQIEETERPSFHWKGPVSQDEGDVLQ